MISILTGAVVGVAIFLLGLVLLGKYKSMQEKLWLIALIYAATGIALGVLGSRLGYQLFGYSAAVAFYLMPLLLLKFYTPENTA